jgi:hypothetical protein
MMHDASDPHLCSHSLTIPVYAIVGALRWFVSGSITWEFCSIRVIIYAYFDNAVHRGEFGALCVTHMLPESVTGTDRKARALPSCRSILFCTRSRPTKIIQYYDKILSMAQPLFDERWHPL